MLKGAIGRRYAGAIFDIALSRIPFERTLEDIQGIAKLFSKRTLAYLLKEPKVPANAKKSAFVEALASRCCLRRSTLPCLLSSAEWQK